MAADVPCPGRIDKAFGQGASGPRE